MKPSPKLPASFLGGDPFNQFRFLYRRELLWKLFDEEYCLSVMKAAYDAGGRGFDLSFDVNSRLFKRLIETTGDRSLIGLGNPSWEQGVVFEQRFIQYNRDRILKTLVDRLFPRDLAARVENQFSHDDVLVFGYDRNVEPLTDKEIESIYLDEVLFKQRISIFKDCQYIALGGSDADWLVSLGRLDIIQQMAQIVRQAGSIPFLLCQYASHIVPIVEDNHIDVEGYVIPLNRDWAWFDRDACVEIVHSIQKPVIAFMPFASGNLRQDIRGALDWLYQDAGVESILYGTADPQHAHSTTILAEQSRSAIQQDR